MCPLCANQREASWEYLSIGPRIGHGPPGICREVVHGPQLSPGAQILLGDTESEPEVSRLVVAVSSPCRPMPFMQKAIIAMQGSR